MLVLFPARVNGDRQTWHCHCAVLELRLGKRFKTLKTMRMCTSSHEEKIEPQNALLGAAVPYESPADECYTLRYVASI